jgi:hypothetical protein
VLRVLRAPGRTSWQVPGVGWRRAEQRLHAEEVARSLFVGQPAGGRAPLLTARRVLHVVSDRRLVHHTVLDALEPVVVEARLLDHDVETLIAPRCLPATANMAWTPKASAGFCAAVCLTFHPACAGLATVQSFTREHTDT